MLFRTLYDDKLAQASYLIGCQATGEAMVVDPNRDADQYIHAARKAGLRITHVTETHIHADFLSGTRELAQQTGARMYLSDEGGADWKYRFADRDNSVLLHDGDVFKVGNIRVQAMHTPGHTPEHISFLITDTPVTDQAMGILTGDFVFVGDVGRPDLLEKAAGITGTMQAGARTLYHSLNKFRQLPDYLQLWPGHGAGSACGKALGAVPQSTVGYEKLFGPAFSYKSEAKFVNYILSGQPEPPKYFAVMKRLNRDGPPLIGVIPEAAQLSADAVRQFLADGLTVIDTRNSLRFARGHVPGTINIPYNRSFSTWAGWLLSYEVPFMVIAEANIISELTHDLAMIGLDNIAGYVTPEAISSSMTQSLPVIRTSEITQNDAVILDVRGASEWEEGHIANSINIPVGYVTDHIGELLGNKYVVHCQSGSRSAIASSVLQAAGVDVTSVLGGYDEWVAMGRPIERSASSI